MIHSAVEFSDGSVIAQLCVPDMRVPIQYALTYPDRRPGAYERLDLVKIASLTFERPDTDTFRCLGLAIESAKRDHKFGTNECLVLNAANEVAVAAFLEHKCAFSGIPDIVESTLIHFSGAAAGSLDALTELDAEVRRYTVSCI